MRPLWLLAPKLPRKYPLTATSPNFGFGGGENDRGGRRSDGLGRQDGCRLLGFFGFFRALPGIFLCVRESLGESGHRQEARHQQRR